MSPGLRKDDVRLILRLISSIIFDELLVGS